MDYHFKRASELEFSLDVLSVSTHLVRLRHILDKIMNFRSAINYLYLVAFTLIVFSQNLLAQVPVPLRVEEEDYTWWYVSLAVLGTALLGTIVVWLRKKKLLKEAADNASARNKREVSGESHSFDADEEMEWLRKHQNVVDRKRKKAPRPQSESRNFETSSQPGNTEAVKVEALDQGVPPVFEFKKVERSTTFDPLPLSNDEALFSAIEQTQDEYEEDEEVRDLALRILTAFRTRNSVEALAEVAIYDLSSALRSKAVSILSEFDHESVFETILLACADPTREVRAAAARGFSRLSFDRSCAWARILETNEQGRMVHAVRAASEGGFVERSFERLTHRDKKHAYEAFVMVALVIKAGEHGQIFEAVRNHRDMQVRHAIIHVLSVVKDRNALTILYNLLEDKQLPAEIKKDIDKAIEVINLVAA